MRKRVSSFLNSLESELRPEAEVVGKAGASPGAVTVTDGKTGSGISERKEASSISSCSMRARLSWSLETGVGVARLDAGCDIAGFALRVERSIAVDNREVGTGVG